MVSIVISRLLSLPSCYSGDEVGKKSFKLKMDKICRPRPFRMTRPNYSIFVEFGPAARYIKLYRAIGREGYLSISLPRESLRSSEQAFSVQIADSFWIWSIFSEVDFHCISRGVHPYSCQRFFYRAAVFTACTWRSTGRFPVSYAIQVMC